MCIKIEIINQETRQKPTWWKPPGPYINFFLIKDSGFRRLTSFLELGHEGVVDLRAVCLEAEDEADDIGDGQQGAARVHQGLDVLHVEFRRVVHLRRL